MYYHVCILDAQALAKSVTCCCNSTRVANLGSTLASTYSASSLGGEDATLAELFSIRT